MPRQLLKSRIIPKPPQASSGLEAEAVLDTLTGTLAKVHLTPLGFGGHDYWTERLLEQACTLTGLFDDQPDTRIRLSLIIPYEQLKQPALAHALAVVLARTQVNPRVLELSVTAEGIEDAYVLNEVTDLGLNLALHDFGKGRASLGVFETVPVSSVSLSPWLTQKLRQPLKSPQYAVAVVSCLVTMSQLLDFEVVACGADDDEQVRSLRNLGCTLQQGRFYASPVRLSHQGVRGALEKAWLGIL